ncbi:MAG TPA: hypothetical protein VNJ51_13785, partial [Candidatus Dormibacteraeota bacterium]|nr:hypothetical protein [Candidatus Dormibacteraeota bacterium]
CSSASSRRRDLPDAGQPLGVKARPPTAHPVGRDPALAGNLEGRDSVRSQHQALRGEHVADNFYYPTAAVAGPLIISHDACEKRREFEVAARVTP